MNRLAKVFVLNKQKTVGSVLILMGVALGVIAQAMLMSAVKLPNFWDISTWLQKLSNNSSPLSGLLLYVVAGLFFIYGLYCLEENPGSLVLQIKDTQSPSLHFGLWYTSLGLAGVTAFFASDPKSYPYGIALVITWLISIVLLIISVCRQEEWQFPNAQKAIEWLSAHRVELLIIGGIILIAFLIRFWDIEAHPYSFINDEAEKGTTAACILDGQCSSLFDRGWGGQLDLSFVPTSVSIWLLGRTALAIRLVSVLAGTLAVLGVFLFSREVFNQKTALAASLLLAALPLNIHFSRIGVDNIVDSLSTTLVLWLVFRGIKRNSTVTLMLAGITAGLFFYTYSGSRLASVLGLLVLSYFALAKRGFFKNYSAYFAVYILAFLITSAPALGYFFTHQDIFATRMKAVGIFQNGALANEMHNTGKSASQILAIQFMKSSLVYIATPAPTNFFDSPQPYLTSLAAIFFMLGLMYVIWRIKDVRFMALFIWFWAAIILGSTITGGPPTSQRMLMSTPALAIITALGIIKIVENIWSGGSFNRWFTPICLASFVIMIGFQNLNFYFGEYRTGHYFEDPTNELTYETRTLISPLHKDGRFYLICDPNIPYLTFASFDFFSPDVEKNYFQVTPQNVAALPKDKDALFIATADRKDEIEKLTTLIPGGEWGETTRRNQPSQILFYSYKIRQNLLQTFKP